MAQKLTKEEFIDKTINYLKKNSTDIVDATPKEVTKNNNTKITTLYIKTTKSDNIDMIFHIGKVYEHYDTTYMESEAKWQAKKNNTPDYSVPFDGVDETEYFKNILAAVINGMDDIPQADSMVDHIDEDQIVIQLINEEANRDLLATLPYKKVTDDIVAVYRAVLDMSSDGTHSMLMTNDAFYSLTDLDPMNEYFNDDMFDIALENTKRLMPTTIIMIPLLQMPDEMFAMLLASAFDSPFTDIDDIPDELFIDESMIVVGNIRNWHGATAMVNNELLDAICDRYHDDIIITPSSTEEIIITKASIYDDGTNDYLSAPMFVNPHLDQTDRLSNNMYKYSKGIGLTTISNNKDNVENKAYLDN